MRLVHGILLVLVFGWALLALGGCTGQKLGKATGEPFALNPGDWTPTAEDLDVKTVD